MPGTAPRVISDQIIERRLPITKSLALSSLFWVALGLGLIAGLAALSGLSWADMAAALGRFSAAEIFLIALAQGAVISLAAWKWVVIYRRMDQAGPHPRMRDAVGATALGATVGLALHPQVSTPLFRAWLARRRGLSAPLAIGTSLYEQIFELTILVSMAAVSALVFLAGGGALFSVLIGAGTLCLITLALAPALRIGAAALSWLAARAPFAGPVERLADGMRVAARMPRADLVLLTALSALRYIIFACLHVLILTHVVDGVALTPLILAFPLVLFALSLPFTPAGLGFFEAAWTGVLIANGVPAAEAAAATLALRIVTTIAAFLIAIPMVAPMLWTSLRRTGK